VETLVSMQARKDGVETAIEPPPKGGVPRVTGDPELLAQLLLNVALNGVQAMAPSGGGHLTFAVGASRRGEKRAVTVRVANDGPPIPEGELERIFDPFYTTKDGGTGLGLSICARIADQHEGELMVRNLPGGRGVEFVLSLPAAENVDG